MMQIEMHRGKYLGKVFLFAFLALLFASVGTLVLLFEDLLLKKMVLGCLMFGLSSFMAYFFLHLFGIRNYTYIMLIEGGTFTNLEKPVGNKVISTDEIASIEYSELKRINQYKLELDRPNRSLSPLINQLKGNDVYITNALISDDDLLRVGNRLIQLMGDDGELKEL